MRCSSGFALVLAGFAVLSLAWAAPAQAGRVVSFTTQVSVAGTPTDPGDLIDVDTGTFAFNVFSGTAPNIDGGHILSNGTSVLLSTATSMSLGGNFFLAGDVVEWDGVTSSARYSFGGSPNVNAIYLVDEDLGSEQLLFSATGSFTLDSQNFTSASLVLWDGSTASLFGDAPPVTGGVANARNIDAINVLANGNVVFSTAQDGASIAGLAGTIQAEDLIEWNPNTGSASLYLDWSTEFDGSPAANIDAATFIPEPATGALLAAGLLGLGARRRRGRA